MFLHATVTGWSEYKCAIYWGWRKLSPKQDLGAEPTAMELVGPNSICQDIKDLYQDVYQLCWLPRRGWCEEATEEQLCKEVLDSIKECLWLKQLPAQPEREQMQLSADAPLPDPCMAFTAMNCSTYEKFTAMNWEMYEEIVALMMDAHQWAFLAAVILEKQMERMSCSISHQCSTSCWHSSSHWCSSSCRRSRSSGLWEGRFPGNLMPWETWGQIKNPQVNTHPGGR